ncbi:hypothetical protein K458DRAFT_8178 [Lentithecium fluviatile CBS 122367]|uniref:Uncharacterized protein n=1 Tax=Lentithecium fluviatile CBS 122367 TaxID=1168545 RepID=A0A6G1JN10_9PLEO|nr:hypothetical protein K458DRAFT_8178 [Lentithecium fluviatile CBS 122367]
MVWYGMVQSILWSFFPAVAPSLIVHIANLASDNRESYVSELLPLKYISEECLALSFFPKAWIWMHLLPIVLLEAMSALNLRHPESPPDVKW